MWGEVIAEKKLEAKFDIKDVFEGKEYKKAEEENKNVLIVLY